MRRVFKCLLGIVLLGVLVAAGARLTAPRWLPALAGYLVEEDPLQPADLIVLLSGAPRDRAGYAADLYREGYARRILCTSSIVPPDLALIGRRLTGAQLSAVALRKVGIPEHAISVINLGASTFEELIVARNKMLAEGWKRAILVSSPYRLRRIRLAWNELTEGNDLRAILRASPYTRVKTTTWWRHERDLLSVQNEYAMLLYYELILFRSARVDEPVAEAPRRPGLREEEHRPAENKPSIFVFNRPANSCG